MYKPSIHRVVYQIWPRSFFDGNHDGVGDLQGVLDKIDYLSELGVTALWISPIYRSPNHDYGYDVQDYYSIQPEMGTMADVRRLINACHARGIEILFDLVANHTSTHHPWFQHALNHPDSPYRAFYHFKHSPSGPPNNWISLFGGHAWQAHPHEADLYYLTLFTPHQADLNWDHPPVRQAMYDVMRFWLNQGVDGFRMDVINLIGKEDGLPSKDPHKRGDQFAGDLIVSHPKSFTYVEEMFNEVLKHRSGLMIGEGVLVTPQAAALYSSLSQPGLDAMFHFDLALLGCGPLGKYDFRKLYLWSVRDFKKIYFKWQKMAEKDGFLMGNFFSNHDHGRAVSRFGDDRRFRSESAKALMVLNFFQRGIPFIYQGEEIGMTNLKLDPKDWKDFEAIQDYHVLQKMMHLPAFMARWVIQKMTRDQARTPMQWSADERAGFSTVQPWMRVNPNTKFINVESQRNNPASVLNFTKACIALHQAHPMLTLAKLKVIDEHHPTIVAFERSDERERFIVLVNVSKRKQRFPMYSELYGSTLVLHNYAHFEDRTKVLRPYEACVFHQALK